MKLVYGNMKYINGTIVALFLNVHHLHLQASYFKMTMKNNIKYTMKPLVALNHIITIWQISHPFKFGRKNIWVFQGCGSWYFLGDRFHRNKSCFSTLVFMKNKLENKFTNRLDLIVCIFAKKIIHWKKFPYKMQIYHGKLLRSNMAIKFWK